MPFWQLYYHFIWATKKRLPMISPQIETQLYVVIVSKVKELGATPFAIGGMEDHVHLVASVPPKVVLAFFVGQVKGSSSHFVNHKLDLEYRFSWQNEYGVFSFGKRSLPEIVQYVQNQKTIHRNRQEIAYFERIGM